MGTFLNIKRGINCFAYIGIEICGYHNETSAWVKQRGHRDEFRNLHNFVQIARGTLCSHTRRLGVAFICRMLCNVIRRPVNSVSGCGRSCRASAEGCSDERKDRQMLQSVQRMWWSCARERERGQNEGGQGG